MIEAISVLIFNNQIRLLQLYPLVNQNLQAITPMAYFWISVAATFILWGITCTIAFENPVEVFLNKILSDAKKQGAVETQQLEDKGEVLDLMNETLGANSEILGQVKDMISNVRVEVKEIQPLKENMDKIRTELSGLKREIKRIEEKGKIQNMCPTCGKSLLPEFKICPYCGENIKLIAEKIVSVEEYR